MEVDNINITKPELIDNYFLYILIVTQDDR